ncbi:hypothetical protein M3J09_005924 [Ascochyta lentis]
MIHAQEEESSGIYQGLHEAMSSLDLGCGSGTGIVYRVRGYNRPCDRAFANKPDVVQLRVLSSG